MEAVETAASPEITTTQDAQPTEGKVTQSQGKEAKADAKQDEELEEIKIGRESAKLPKNIAKMVKDLERGFHMKAQEAASKEKALEERFAKMFKENPKAALAKYGVDPEEFAEMTLAEKLEQLAMSPEQKELAQLRAEKAEREKAAKEAEEKAKAEAEEKEMGEAQRAMDVEIADAWKESGLPQDPFYVKQICALMHDSRVLMSQGKYDRALTAKEAAGIVKERFEGFLSSLFSKMDPEGIHKRLGEENFKRLREWDLGRVTGKAAPTPNGQNPRSGDQKPVSAARKANKPMNEKEYREYFDRLAQES